ncbi:hypothetical protein [Cellvibrio sp.]|uniref:hypothetical protein n=1 Tax=Cellvibrio sp. TaxID=1965322 RepID=UPI0039647C9C
MRKISVVFIAWFISGPLDLVILLSLECEQAAHSLALKSGRQTEQIFTAAGVRGTTGLSSVLAIELAATKRLAGNAPMRSKKKPKRTKIDILHPYWHHIGAFRKLTIFAGPYF